MDSHGEEVESKDFGLSWRESEVILRTYFEEHNCRRPLVTLGPEFPSEEVQGPFPRKGVGLLCREDRSYHPQTEVLAVDTHREETCQDMSGIEVHEVDEDFLCWTFILKETGGLLLVMV